MLKKNYVFLVLASILILSLISGCIGGGQFGAPSGKTGIKGRAVTPESCFNDSSSNTAITQGKPLPKAQVQFYSGNVTAGI